MTRTRFLSTVILLLLACGPAGFAQDKQKEAAMRSVQGVVTNADDSLAVGAVVQMKNMKTLQVRSFITQEDGVYHFYELSPDIDYELKAEFKGGASPTKIVSSFDSRKKVVVNLKVVKK